MHEITRRKDEIANRDNIKNEKDYSIDESIDVELTYKEASEEPVSDNTLPEAADGSLKTAIEPAKTENPADELLMKFTDEDIPDKEVEAEPVDVEIKEERIVNEDDEDEEDEEAAKEKNGRKRRVKERKPHLIRNGIIIVLAALIITFGASLGREYFRSTEEGGKQIEINIPEGTSTKEVAQILKEAGVTRYQTPFLTKVYFSEYKGKLRYGTYLLTDRLSLDDIIEGMSTGSLEKPDKIFTMPEGFTIEQTAAKLEEENVMTAQEFKDAVQAAVADFRYPDELPAADQVFYQLEGYLYPDTYNLTAEEGATELVTMMLDEFYEKYDEDCQAKAKKAGLSMKEVMIRASLLMKETDNMKDYPMIAGVINNRLAIGMALQFDSTVIYGQTKGIYGVDRVLNKDLKYESPYNTYLNQGLPVGPISNPCIEAIQGVLSPKKHDYLYFQTDTTKNDGSNVYFKTYKEHDAAASTGTH